MGIAECAERDCAAIIPLRKKQKERDLRIPRHSDEWRSLYRRRSAVEREFGRLKHQYGFVRGRLDCEARKSQGRLQGQLGWLSLL